MLYRPDLKLNSISIHIKTSTKINKNQIASFIFDLNNGSVLVFNDFSASFNI